MLHFLVILYALANFANCWPDFELYTQKNKDQFFTLDVNNCKNSPLSLSRNTTIFIHGFLASGQDSWILQAKDYFIQNQDINFIAVNWHDGAATINYIKAKENMIIAAKKLNEFISACNIPPKSIYCVGHSLGAQACGLSAKGLVYQRITGLDPAGPLFHHVDESERLNKNDALFVDIINTDSCLGLHKSIGHKNFYPNSGNWQPGCIDNLDLCEYLSILDPVRLQRINLSLSCSHTRAYWLYVDNLTSGKSCQATRCDSWKNFENGACKCTSLDKDCAKMGYLANEGSVLGDFYLDSAKQTPYCLN